MPSTARGLPYPAGSDAPDVPAAVEALAEELDDQLDAIDSDVAGKADSSAVSSALAGKQDADSDLSAIASATLSGDGFLKRASGVWSLDEPEGGGGSLPDQTGNGGAVLGTDGADAAWTWEITVANGDGGTTYTRVDPDTSTAVLTSNDSSDRSSAVLSTPTQAQMYANDDSEGAEIKVTSGGNVEITASGAVTVNGTVVDPDTSGASAGDVLAWDGSKIALAAPTGGGGGGLVLVDSGTFSAASEEHADGVITSTHDDYELVIRIDSVGSGTPMFNLRGRASSADITSGVYYGAGWAKSYGGGFVAWGQADSSTELNLRYPDAASEGHVIMRISKITSSKWKVTTDYTCTALACAAMGWINAAIDGFKIYPASSDFTGSWVLWGYPK